MGVFSKIEKNKGKSSLALVLALATPLVAHYEGLRTRAYLDPIGIPTICWGETVNVKLGQIKTVEECNKMLTARLGYFAVRVDAMIQPEISPQEMAAYSSLAYNVGLGAFEKSTLLKKVNAGDRVGACNELPRWNKAGGKVLSGLVLRREAEKRLCKSGL